MTQSLRDVLVIPAGGGKSTLCQDPYYLDVDALYFLEETDETYDRLNSELDRRASLKSPVHPNAIEEHRQRLAEYEGPARCLLVHSLELARQGGLNIKGALVPDQSLHEKSIEDRNEIGRWFARETRNNVLTQCKTHGHTPTTYKDWDTLRQVLEKLRDNDDDSCGDAGSPTPTTSDSSGSQIGQNKDEEHLLNILCLALGCPLEQQ